MKDYGNKISLLDEELYLNQWSMNKEMKEDMLMVSYLMKAEGGSIIQILIAEDSLYNGIFHLTKFKFEEEDNRKKLVIQKFDDIHDAKQQEYEQLILQLPEIIEKYQGELKGINFENTIPLHNAKNYNLLVLE